MIVCICRAVSDRAIRAARDAGAGTVEAVGAATGAGTCCGCCRGAIAKLLAEPSAASAEPADAVPRRAAADKLETP